MSCDLILSAHGNVSALCIDQTNGCIVVGVQDTIRYDNTKSMQNMIQITNLVSTSLRQVSVLSPGRKEVQFSLETCLGPSSSCNLS